MRYPNTEKVDEVIGLRCILPVHKERLVRYWGVYDGLKVGFEDGFEAGNIHGYNLALDHMEEFIKNMRGCANET